MITQFDILLGTRGWDYRCYRRPTSSPCGVEQWCGLMIHAGASLSLAILRRLYEDYRRAASHSLSRSPAGADARLLGRRLLIANDSPRREGHRLGSRQRESSINQLLTAESELLPYPRVEENARTCALFSSFLQRTRKSWTGWRREGNSNCQYRFWSFLTTALGGVSEQLDRRLKMRHLLNPLISGDGQAWKPPAC